MTEPPTVDLVAPVRNEHARLEAGVRKLHPYLTPINARLVIADNASTDDTGPIGQRLAAELDRVDYRHIETPGKGAAIRAAWSTSNATIVAFTDIDLAAHPAQLESLLQPLWTGAADIAIATRRHHQSEIDRPLSRRVASRVYNGLARRLLHLPYRDLQCGFKAATTQSIQPVLDQIAADGWAFDTELLVLAHRHGLRIAEVPVSWIEPKRRLRWCPSRSNYSEQYAGCAERRRRHALRELVIDT